MTQSDADITPKWLETSLTYCRTAYIYTHVYSKNVSRVLYVSFLEVRLFKVKIIFSIRNLNQSLVNAFHLIHEQRV